MLTRLALDLASRRNGRARLSILIFHRVLDAPDPLFPGEVDVVAFERIVGWVSRWFNLLPFTEALARWRAGELPPCAATITFDDGYADNLRNAAPILARHGASAMLFVATGFVDGGRMWNDSLIEAVRNTGKAELDLASLGLGAVPVETLEDKRSAIARLIPTVKYLPKTERAERLAVIVEAAAAPLPDDLMLTTDELRRWRAMGMEVGAHTVTHPILARTEPAEARREIADSRAQLEAWLGERVGVFAYPNGKPGEDYLPEHVSMVEKMDFDAAVSTSWGAVAPCSGRFELPRFTPWDRSRLRFGLRLVQNLVQSRDEASASRPAA